MTHVFNCLLGPFDRKFADIEAANQRLASALYSKDEEKTAASLAAEQWDMADRSDGSGPDLSALAEAAASPCSEALFNPRDGGSSAEKQSGRGNLWRALACRGESKAVQQQENRTHNLAEIPSTSSHTACQPSTRGHPPSRPPETASKSSDSQMAQPDSGSAELTQNVEASPPGSPGLSPPAPNSCDLSVWMFSDIPTCTQGQKSFGDISESQWSEMVDLLSAGSPDGTYAEVEAYFESICPCRGDSGQEEDSAEVGFVDFFDSFTQNPGEIVFEERLPGDACEYMFEDGDGWQETTQRESKDGLSTAPVVVEQLPAYRSDGSELQTCQHPLGEGPCTLGSKPHFTPFEGVAQSFTVPLHHSRARALPTLPREEDWPFTDILEDKTSMYG